MLIVEKEKKKWRRRFKRRRQSLREKLTADEQILEQLQKIEALWQAKTVYIYLALDVEVETRKIIELLWQKAIKVGVPRVEGKKLAFCQIKTWSDLVPGFAGIYEPKANCHLLKEEKTPLIIPGLGFDLSGNRLGRGGGFYDRFLDEEKKHLKIALAYDWQLTKKLPVNSEDQKVDLLVTATKIIDWQKFGLNLSYNEENEI